MTLPESPFRAGKSRKQNRYVHFRDTRTEISIESLACLSEMEKDELWFTDREIECFKARARALCVDLAGLGAAAIVMDDDDNENIRGLELRLCQERQKRKYMIVQAILRAQKRFKDPKQLSYIARKCSVWSKTVAVIVAQRDYCALYQPAQIDSIAGLPPLENYPLPFKAKEPCNLPDKRPTSPIPHVHQSLIRPRPNPFSAFC
jgi:hypothetical protein